MARHKEPGYEHAYDTGEIILCTAHGSAVIVGLRIRADMGGQVVYYIRPDNEPQERVIFEHEIIGYCTKVERNRTQKEVIPGL